MCVYIYTWLVVRIQCFHCIHGPGSIPGWELRPLMPCGKNKTKTNEYYQIPMGFPDGLAGKESTYNAGDIGDTDLIPGSGRFPEGGNGNSLQYSC